MCSHGCFMAFFTQGANTEAASNWAHPPVLQGRETKSCDSHRQGIPFLMPIAPVIGED
jgi:hypothetical protein